MADDQSPSRRPRGEPAPGRDPRSGSVPDPRRPLPGPGGDRPGAGPRPSPPPREPDEDPDASHDELLDEELAATFDSTDDVDAEDPLLHVTSSGRDTRPATTPAPRFEDPEDDEGFFDTKLDSINARLDDLEAAESAPAPAPSKSAPPKSAPAPSKAAPTSPPPKAAPTSPPPKATPPASPPPKAATPVAPVRATAEEEAFADEHDALDTHNDVLEDALDALEADADRPLAEAAVDADDEPDVAPVPPGWRDRMHAATTGAAAPVAAARVEEPDEFEPTLDALEDGAPEGGDLDEDVSGTDELVHDVWSDDAGAADELDPPDEPEAPASPRGDTRALPRPAVSGPAWSRGQGPGARARQDALGGGLDAPHDAADADAAQDLQRASREVARGLDAGDGDDAGERLARVESARRAAERITRPLQALEPEVAPRDAGKREATGRASRPVAAGAPASPSPAAPRAVATPGARESATSRLGRKLDEARPRDPPPSQRLEAGEAARQVERALRAPTREDIEVTLRRAYRTLERMEGLGFPTDDLEGRLGGAASMAAQGQLQASLVLCEEVLVLARTMIQADARGHPRDPLAARVAALFGALLGGDDFTQAVNARTGRVVAQILEDTLAGPTFQAAVGRLLERRLAAHVEESAFVDAVAQLFEARIARHLRGREFAAAAARAAAEAPQDLLDRPETIARIDAVATARDRALLGSSRFAERVRELIADKLESATRELTDKLGAPERTQEAVLADPRLADLVAKLVQPKLDGLLDTPAAQAALEARGAAWLQSAPSSPALQDVIDARARARAEEVTRGELFLADVDGRTRRLFSSEEFRLRFETLLRGSQVVHEVFDERLGASEALTRVVGEQLVERVSELVPRLVQPIVEAQLDRAKHDLLEDGAFSARVDEVARRRAEGIVDTPGFRAAVETRARAMQDELAARLGREVETKVAAGTAAATDKLLESQLLRTKVDQAAARAVERQERSVHDQLAQAAEAHKGLERKLEALVPVLIKTALADGGSAGARLEQIAEAAAKRVLDEEWVVRIIRKEITNREALRAASISGSDGVSGDVGEAVRKIVGEKLDEFRQAQLKERRERRDARTGGAPPARREESPEVREIRSNRTTERRAHEPEPPARPRPPARETDPDADTHVERVPRPPRPPERPPARGGDDEPPRRPQPPRRPG